MKYLLTVRLEFEAADDADARASMRFGGGASGLCTAVALAENALLEGRGRGARGTGSAKLQRLNEHGPPRLLAKWPEE